MDARGGRPVTGAAMFLFAMIVLAGAACSSGKRAEPSPSAGGDGVATVAPSATAPPPRSLAESIGTRGGLPENDPIDLAQRYRITPGRALAGKAPAPEPAVGERRDFFVLRLTPSTLASRTPPDIVTVTATLVARSSHAYFYEDNALAAPAADVERAADLFESTTWPVVTAAFGEPLSPGVDGDPRIIVLQSELGGAGGYFQGDDAYVRAVRPLSNEAEMVYIDRTVRAGTAAFNVTLAHEFQHLIHDRNDRSEESWVNEGLSDDAAALVGGAGTFVQAFAARPDTQLNAWPSATNAHYGAGSAFFRYLASRFGGDAALGGIARAQGNGEAGVDEFLASIGESVRFRDIFADWIAANVLNLDAGPYGNPGDAVDLRIANDLVAGSSASGDAHQFGTDYYALSGLGGSDYRLAFRGEPLVPVLPTVPADGGAMLWGNAGDSIDTRLTREVDLTAATAPALTFRTWYDIERWFDWGYVSVSTDGGSTWQPLTGTHTTEDDRVKVALGPGYTGKSGGGEEAAWVDERVSLAAYAGKKVLLRFEYVTDGGTHREGWAIDDVAVEGTAFADPDDGDAGWRPEGWVRIDRELPQTYVVRLIEKMGDGSSRVQDVPLDAAQRGELRFSAAGVDEAILAVAGSTEGTDQAAPYTVELRR